MIQLSLFRGVYDTQPRPVTLEELVTMMRTDQSVRDLTEKHRYARSVGDGQGASRYKKMMTSFGVAARFEGGRQQKHIVELTGLSLVDLDHIPSERMAEVLEKVRSDGAEGVKQCAEQYCVCGHKGRPTQYELQDIPLSKELLEHLGFRFDEADYKIKWWKCYSALSRENTSPFSTFAR